MNAAQRLAAQRSKNPGSRNQIHVSDSKNI